VGLTTNILQAVIPQILVFRALICQGICRCQITSRNIVHWARLSSWELQEVHRDRWCHLLICTKGYLGS